MIRALDARLIAAHQWVVDFVQLRPALLAEFCAVGMSAAAVLRFAVTPARPAWALALDLLCAGLLLALCRMPALLHSLTSLFTVRLTWVGFVCFDTGVLLLAPWPVEARFVASVLTSLFLMSYYYFAVCRPPRPRAPRARLAPGGAL